MCNVLVKYKGITKSTCIYVYAKYVHDDFINSNMCLQIDLLDDNTIFVEDNAIEWYCYQQANSESIQEVKTLSDWIRITSNT